MLGDRMLVKDITKHYKYIGISRNEAKVSGIEWPLKQGWLEQEYKGTPEQEKRFKLALHDLNRRSSESRKKKRLKRERNKSHVTSRKDGFYETSAWRELRYKVLSMHNGKCSLCGRTAKQSNSALHVDHIVPRSKDKSLELDITNLQVLCRDCNLGKCNKDSRDWRE